MMMMMVGVFSLFVVTFVDTNQVENISSMVDLFSDV